LICLACSMNVHILYKKMRVNSTETPILLKREQIGAGCRLLCKMYKSIIFSWKCSSNLPVTILTYLFNILEGIFMSRLQGKIALITGAGGGQGAAEAYLFAKEGAKVIATDIQFENVQAVADKINAEFPGQALALKHDVSSEEDWNKVIQE